MDPDTKAIAVFFFIIIFAITLKYWTTDHEPDYPAQVTVYKNFGKFKPQKKENFSSDLDEIDRLLECESKNVSNAYYYDQNRRAHDNKLNKDPYIYEMIESDGKNMGLIKETFKANSIENPIIHTLDNPSDDYKDTHRHRLVFRQIPVSEFLSLVTDVNNLISGEIIEMTKLCDGMNGAETANTGHVQFSLGCYNNSYEIEDKILNKVYDLIESKVYEKYRIHLNWYITMADMYNNMDLLERVIYPLQYSGLYTLNGIQYTTPRMIKRMVTTNLDIRNVLYTILSRRNIVLDVDTDKHIHTDWEVDLN